MILVPVLLENTKETFQCLRLFISSAVARVSGRIVEALQPPQSHPKFSSEIECHTSH